MLPESRLYQLVQAAGRQALADGRLSPQLEAEILELSATQRDAEFQNQFFQLLAQHLQTLAGADRDPDSLSAEKVRAVFVVLTVLIALGQTAGLYGSDEERVMDHFFTTLKGHPFAAYFFDAATEQVSSTNALWTVILNYLAS